RTLQLPTKARIASRKSFPVGSSAMSIPLPDPGGLQLWQHGVAEIGLLAATRVDLAPSRSQQPEWLAWIAGRGSGVMFAN
ncbi:MAG: hypothetical protein ACKOPO_08725, partial [Novosphingobium sp.]